VLVLAALSVTGRVTVPFASPTTTSGGAYMPGEAPPALAIWAGSTTSETEASPITMLTTEDGVVRRMRLLRRRHSVPRRARTVANLFMPSPSSASARRDSHQLALPFSGADERNATQKGHFALSLPLSLQSILRQLLND